MLSNYSSIIYKEERHEDYVRHNFRSLLSGPNSTLNRFIENTNDYWDTGIEVLARELIQNTTEKYNNLVAAK